QSGSVLLDHVAQFYLTIDTSSYIHGAYTSLDCGNLENAESWFKKASVSISSGISLENPEDQKIFRSIARTLGEKYEEEGDFQKAFYFFKSSTQCRDPFDPLPWDHYDAGKIAYLSQNYGQALMYLGEVVDSLYLEEEELLIVMQYIEDSQKRL
ncbi:MAG: hypothetical protein GY915_09460, partial [bacterium]|nr:hypothetical protein [bacterium]